MFEGKLKLACLACIAGLVTPRLTGASAASRDEMLADCLRYLRTQIQVYEVEHDGVPPGFYWDQDATDEQDSATFVAQLTLFSDMDGDTSDQRTAGFPLGPYIADMPANPINQRNGVWIVTVAAMPAPDESQACGWIYNPVTGQIVANVTGTDSNGVAYANY